MRGDDMIQFELSDDSPVYVISVAAQLSGLHPQTLRTYDRLGLVSPGRAAGGRAPLLAARHPGPARGAAPVPGRGRQPPGIKRILELEDEQQRHRALLAELHDEITQLRAELESTRAVAARLAGLLRSRNENAALVPVRRSDAPFTAQPAARRTPARTEPGAEDASRAAKLRKMTSKITNNG